MFNKIAPNYDLLNHLLSLNFDKQWRKKAISTLKDHQPKSILDIATGTGDLAIEAAKQLSVERIVGLDIADKMLSIGRKKIQKKGLESKISMELGDSENLKYQTESFDAVTAAFGVRNFEDLEKGLEEMHRVLKKGGKIVILEFTKPRKFPFKQIFDVYFN